MSNQPTTPKLETSEPPKDGSDLSAASCSMFALRDKETQEIYEIALDYPAAYREWSRYSDEWRLRLVIREVNVVANSKIHIEKMADDMCQKFNDKLSSNAESSHSTKES